MYIEHVQNFSYVLLEIKSRMLFTRYWSMPRTKKTRDWQYWSGGKKRRLDINTEYYQVWTNFEM